MRITRGGLLRSSDAAGAFAPLTFGGRAGLFTGLADVLETGLWSAGIQVLGDSTGAGTPRWPRLFAQYLATKYPAYSVVIKDWQPGSSTYADTVLQTGPSGFRRMTCNGASATHPGDGTSLTGKQRWIARVNCTNWSKGSGAVQTIAAHYGLTGTDRGIRVQVNNFGYLQWNWSPDGAALVGNQATAPVTIPNGTVGWVRVDFDPATGISQFYQSTDNAVTPDGITTWTKLGADVTFGATTIYWGASTAFEVGARGGSAEPFIGDIYGVWVKDRSVIDGGTDVVSGLIDAWMGGNGTGVPTWSGSPTLVLVNGSWSGAALDNLALTNALTIKLMTPLYHQLACLYSCSHNDLNRRDKAYYDEWTTYHGTVSARLSFAAFGMIGQNPRNSPTNWIMEHAGRRSMHAQWASRNGLSFIDVFRAFSNDPRGLAVLLVADGIHPSDNDGSPLWAQTVEAVYNARA